MAPTAHRRQAIVLDAPIDALSWDEGLERIANWAECRESRYVCLCNVHSVVTASRDGGFRKVIAGADLATPDGMPVAWSLSRLGFPGQQRINGPDLMWRLCERAAQAGTSVYFYGSARATLDLLQARLAQVFPALRIAGMLSPPFRELSKEEDRAVVDDINGSGAGLVFVGLGCPKQELWMARHRGAIQAVMLGVGAALDYHAGTLLRAPLWMQHRGLEWLYRLAREPRRLWRRYLSTNSLFIARMVWQLLARRLRT